MFQTFNLQSPSIKLNKEIKKGIDIVKEVKNFVIKNMTNVIEHCWDHNQKYFVEIIEEYSWMRILSNEQRRIETILLILNSLFLLSFVLNQNKWIRKWELKKSKVTKKKIKESKRRIKKLLYYELYDNMTINQQLINNKTVINKLNNKKIIINDKKRQMSKMKKEWIERSSKK